MDVFPFNPAIIVGQYSTNKYGPEGSYYVAKYAWPGGYPMLYICDDGGVLCPECVQDNIDQCCDPHSGGWYVTGHGANWEDPSLFCDHCNNRIESAYAEDQVPPTRSDDAEFGGSIWAFASTLSNGLDQCVVDLMEAGHGDFLWHVLETSDQITGGDVTWCGSDVIDAVREYYKRKGDK